MGQKQAQPGWETGAAFPMPKADGEPTLRETSEKQLHFLKERLADANINILAAVMCLSGMSNLLKESKRMPLNQLLTHVGKMGTQITEMESELNVVRDDVQRAETALTGIEGRTDSTLESHEILEDFVDDQLRRRGLEDKLKQGLLEHRGWTIADRQKLAVELITQDLDAAAATVTPAATPAKPEAAAARPAAPAPAKPSPEATDVANLAHAARSATCAAAESFAAAAAAAAAARAAASDLGHAARASLRRDAADAELATMTQLRDEAVREGARQREDATKRAAAAAGDAARERAAAAGEREIAADRLEASLASHAATRAALKAAASKDARNDAVADELDGALRDLAAAREAQAAEARRLKDVVDGQTKRASVLTDRLRRALDLSQGREPSVASPATSGSPVEREPLRATVRQDLGVRHERRRMISSVSVPDLSPRLRDAAARRRTTVLNPPPEYAHLPPPGAELPSELPAPAKRRAPRRERPGLAAPQPQDAAPPRPSAYVPPIRGTVLRQPNRQTASFLQDLGLESGHAMHLSETGGPGAGFLPRMGVR